MRRGKLLSVTLAALPILAAGCSSQLPEYGMVLEPGLPQLDQTQGNAQAAAKDHLLNGRLGLAAKYYKMAVDADPTSVEALNGLAATYDRMRRYDLAERYYRRALALNPNSAQTLNNLGYSYLLQGKSDLAAAFLDDAKRTDSASPIVHNNQQMAEAALRLHGPAFAPNVAEAAPQPEQSETTPPEAQPQGPHIERMTPAVQMLITEPQPEAIPASFLTGARPAPDHSANSSMIENASFVTSDISDREGQPARTEQQAPDLAESRNPPSGLVSNVADLVAVVPVVETSLAEESSETTARPVIGPEPIVREIAPLPLIANSDHQEPQPESLAGSTVHRLDMAKSEPVNREPVGQPVVLIAALMDYQMPSVPEVEFRRRYSSPIQVAAVDPRAEPQAIEVEAISRRRYSVPIPSEAVAAAGTSSVEVRRRYSEPVVLASAEALIPSIEAPAPRPRYSKPLNLGDGAYAAKPPASDPVVESEQRPQIRLRLGRHMEAGDPTLTESAETPEYWGFDLVASLNQLASYILETLTPAPQQVADSNSLD